MVYAQPGSYPGEWHSQIPLRFWYPVNLVQTTRPYNNQHKERTFKLVDFALLADHSVLIY